MLFDQFCKFFENYDHISKSLLRFSENCGHIPEQIILINYEGHGYIS